MNRRPLLMGVVGAAVVSACGGGGRAEQQSPVNYIGTTLQLNGKAYEFGPIDVLYTNQLTLPTYTPKEVIVQVLAGQADTARALLTSYGLSIIQDFPRFGQMFVAVPAGFEPQWVLALRDIPSVFERAWLSTPAQLA
jgi:hypothetical protein